MEYLPGSATSQHFNYILQALFMQLTWCNESAAAVQVNMIHTSIKFAQPGRFCSFQISVERKHICEAMKGAIQGHLQRNSSRFFIVANYTRRIILVSNPTYFPESCLLGHPECEYDGKSRSEAAKIVECL